MAAADAPGPGPSAALGLAMLASGGGKQLKEATSASSSSSSSSASSAAVPAARSSEAPSAPESSHENHPFFHYYGQLVHQQNMLQDAVRTGTYHKAFITNPTDFKGKVVVDVGTGSGILAFFAVKAGAKKVYAIEASDVAEHARTLMERNGLSDKVVVIKNKVEDVELPEPVDIIISEPMGFLLVHERMLESFIAARDKFLRPGGLMMPTTGTMFFGPFTDQAMWDEQDSKVTFWETTDFWGLDLSSLKQQARVDHFSQPVVGYFAPSILLCTSTATHTISFARDPASSLREFTVPFAFEIERTAILHGIAGWFDVLFRGSSNSVPLSTSPYTAGTHWYQCRFLLEDPLAVNRGQRVAGRMHFVANDKYSYDITMDIALEGTSISKTAKFSLADQYFAYYSGTEAGNAAATPAVASAWASGDPQAGVSEAAGAV